MNRSIFALMLSTFALGLSEFMPMGLLPVIAQDLSISIPKAGMLITAYAVGVIVASPVMTLLLSPLSKKRALVILLFIFTAGNMISMLAPGYNSLVVSRVITSLAHGSFFGIGSILAINLAPPEKRAGAVSLVFMGLAIANIGGVPLASWLGEVVGWRAAFMSTTVLGAVAAVAMIVIIPKGENGTRVNVRSEVMALIQPQVLGIFAGTMMFSASLFTLYTYIAVVLRTLAEATPAFVAVILSVIGIGFTIGGYISSRVAVRWCIDRAIVLFFFLSGVILLIYPAVAVTYTGAAIATFIWGIVGYATSPLLQTKIVGAAKDAPALASSVNIGIFNLGNAAGAVIGGAVITAGFGYEWIAPAAGVVSLLGMVAALVPMISRQKTNIKKIQLELGGKL